jgi:hypothetical protein
MHVVPVAVAAAAVLAQVSCLLPGTGGAPVAREVTDVGRVCLYDRLPSSPGAGNPQQFASGEPVFVVHETHCFSSSCSRDVVATCQVTAAGTTRQVTSTTSWLDLTRQNQACTDDCRVLTTTCSTDALAAGTHVFAFGTREITLVVPSETTTAPCVDSSE